ncbi:hypothetical protein [Actinomyces weissii]|uniref:Uncharacterized protein n=1 Tax=Actinomyces weissii TaxID=675090 RepID=A0A7T7M8L3_9ACTO|nr:hypothetical protein [Actinomyces weissii]QQM66924.1 hypothetical protein JG540_07650 [Actinomyces weissii]
MRIDHVADSWWVAVGALTAACTPAADRPGVGSRADDGGGVLVPRRRSCSCADDAAAAAIVTV